MSKSKILIVEDESIVALDLRNTLEMLGYEVVAQASRGEEAIRKTGVFLPDLVLMDIQLKGDMDGIEAASQIRTLHNLPVIFITAHSDADTLLRAKISEPFGYIIKPFEERELECNIAIALYRHAIEQELRSSELKFRGVIEQSTDAIVLTNNQGRILAWNEAMESITSISRDEAAKQYLWDVQYQLNPKELQTPELYQKLRSIYQTILAAKTIPQGNISDEREIFCPDGSSHIIESKSFIVEGAGNFWLASFIRDITDRRQEEMKLRKLSQAVEQSANAIVITDPDGMIEYVNPIFSRITGYTLEEARGNTPRVLKSGAQSNEYYESLWQTIKSGKTWKGEFHNKRKDGSLYWEDASIAPVFDSQGKLTNFIAVKEDITTRKEYEAAEHEQRQLAEALLDTASALNSTLDLNAVLDRILENVGRVVPSDTVNVMLIEDQGLRVAGQRGFKERGLEKYLMNAGFSIELFHSLQEIFQSGLPKIIPNVHEDPAWVVPTPKMAWVRSYLGAPILIRGEVIGFLNLDSSIPNFFTATHARRLQAFASQAATAIDNARLFHQTRQLAITDGLTGLFNGRYFFELAESEFERACRYARQLSIIMLDADHFKSVNDQFGHQVGDQVLLGISNYIRHILRKSDVCARYGGEEFIIMLPETCSEAAFQVAERVRKSVEDSPYILNASISVPVTVSLGLASLTHEHQDLDALIYDADQALYLSKAKGRNCVSIWK